MSPTATLKKIGKSSDDIFEILMESGSNFYPYWHYHPQYEIMLIEKSTGIQYVGDNIRSFRSGDIIFMGSGIPHQFRNYPEYFDENSGKTAKATVLYFSDSFVDSDFFNLREMSDIAELLKLSRRGLQIQGRSKIEVARRLRKIVRAEGAPRLIDFISLLHYIASEGEYKVLSSLGFTSKPDQQDLSRLNRIFDYLLNNFQQNITLGDASRVANMSSSAFCRYFKDRTNKTFVSFLNEIRIGHACRQLIEENEMNISEICYECGFNNLTNFNIQFKKLKGISPKAYRDKHISSAGGSRT